MYTGASSLFTVTLKNVDNGSPPGAGATPSESALPADTVKTSPERTKAMKAQRNAIGARSGISVIMPNHLTSEPKNTFLDVVTSGASVKTGAPILNDAGVTRL